RNLPALAATPPRRHDGPAPRGSQPGTDAAGGVYSYPQPAPHSLPNKDDLPNSSQQGEGSRYRRLNSGSREETLTWSDGQNRPVELWGFEPQTPSMPWRCATRLRYSPLITKSPAQRIPDLCLSRGGIRRS